MNEVNELWDLIIEYDIATYEELQLITYINGYSIDTLNDVIFAKSGYHDIEQYEEWINSI